MTCNHPDTISRRDARRMAGYLHTANALIVAVERRDATPATLKKARDLLTRVMGEFMELRGQTDFYGNPTHTCEVQAILEGITL